MDDQARIRFVRGTAEPPPLAEPLVEEEALLLPDDNTDAIQRLRAAVVRPDIEQESGFCAVWRADLTALLAAHAALVEAVRERDALLMAIRDARVNADRDAHMHHWDIQSYPEYLYPLFRVLDDPDDWFAEYTAALATQPTEVEHD